MEIVGNYMANRIIGSINNDTIWGGKGNDTLTGGDGEDVFAFNSGDGKDVITDYNEGQDVIQFAENVKVSSVSRVGSDVIFKLGSKGTVTVKNVKDNVVSYIEGDEEKTYPSIGNGSNYKISDDGEGVTLASTYSKKTFDVNDYNEMTNVRTINASNVTNDIVIKGNKNNNVIYGSQGDNTLNGGKGDDTIKGSDSGENFYVYNNGDGNDLILNWGSNDAVSWWDSGDVISIASGMLSADVRVKDDTVIFTVGKGKISLQGAAGQSVTYWYDDEYHTQIYSNGNSDVLSDDNYEVTPSDLSAIVENKAIDYSDIQSDSSLSFTPKNNSILKYTFVNKKK